MHKVICELCTCYLPGVMRTQHILRTLLFAIFFGVGATALSVSILCDELVRYYNNRHLLKQAQQSLTKLESLNADYEALVGQLQNEPNLVKRIAPATLGTKAASEDTIYPKVKAEQLAAARQALADDSGEEKPGPAVPEWLVRCSESRRRVMLFLAGAFLILTGFVCFAPAK